MRILFVCLGNICRSPTAEAVMADLLEQEGYSGQIEIDSAGTGDWHIGNPPDRRAVEAASKRGLSMTSRARQVDQSDFERFDLIVAMDSSNHQDLLLMKNGDGAEVRLLREFAEGGSLDVPDPYFGGDDGFNEVLDMLELNLKALLEQVSGDA
jgi:protein-tyrosine phosphatase